MSFVKKIFTNMSGTTDDDNDDDDNNNNNNSNNTNNNKEQEEEDDISEETSTESSSDTGIFTGGISDLESSGHIDADCSQISNFFGYWKNLINQEAKFQSQLNDLSKQLSVRDAEANKLRFQMDELQRDVFAKSAGADRIQAELQAAYKEIEILKNRIWHLENDLKQCRERNNQINAELSEKSNKHTTYESDTNAKIVKLEETIKQLQNKIQLLQVQLDNLNQEKEKLQLQQTTLLIEKEEQRKKLEETIEQNQQQKQEIEKKWKEDFEKLRTINIVKEQQLLDDFEWKLRQVQQSCKLKLEEKDQHLQETYKISEQKLKEAEEMMKKVEVLKSYEIEVRQLRGLTVDQEISLKLLIEREEDMKMVEENLKSETKRLQGIIEEEKKNLQVIQRKHYQELVDKERHLKQTLNQKRTEIAMYWEEKLLHECERLKNELEQIHNEEKHNAMEMVRKEKDEELEKTKQIWESKVKDYIKEITSLKESLHEKEAHYREEIIKLQTNADRNIFELRRLMDKIDMNHHERFEKLVQDHDQELEQINKVNEKRINEIEINWQNQMVSIKKNLEMDKEKMEKESQQKIESLIAQHHSELDTQWQNLIRQKSEAIQLLQDEFISKYKILEEQFNTQYKSHESREIELLKTIDSLKNKLDSKNSTINDLQNNCDTLEGGIQVLNGEIFQQNEQIVKIQNEAEQKIKLLKENINSLQEQQVTDKENYHVKLIGAQKQSQETIDYLQKKCLCLTKLFEDVRLRYERRDSRQEDLNTIADLRQMIAEQEKDLACLNEEKRYFQMRLISLETRLNGERVAEEDNGSGDDETFEDAQQQKSNDDDYSSMSIYSTRYSEADNTTLSIPATIPECDE